MTISKSILIVDDEDSIVQVLAGSLEKLGPDYQILTARSGFAALDELYRHPIDLLVTDYLMLDMDGLELLEAVRYLDSETAVIVITAHDSDFVRQESKRLQVTRYLTKPLDIATFRRAVQDVLGTKRAKQGSILTLSDEQYQQCSPLLEKLRQDVGARCLFLISFQGNLLIRSGDTYRVPIEEIASLLGGGIATLREAGRSLDGNADAINLAYREGKHEYLYALNIDQNLLLVLVIDRGQYSSRLGTVWYYIQQAALSLREVVETTAYIDPQEVFHQDVDQEFSSELDKLFQ